MGKKNIEPSVLFPELTMFVEFYFLNFLPDGNDINLEILFFQNSVEAMSLVVHLSGPYRMC